MWCITVLQFVVSKFISRQLHNKIERALQLAKVNLAALSMTAFLYVIYQVNWAIFQTTSNLDTDVKFLQTRYNLYTDIEMLIVTNKFTRVRKINKNHIKVSWATVKNINIQS